MNLAELIRTAKGDRTYEQLSVDSGGAFTAERMRQIATNAKPVREFMKPDTIRSLAQGLRVPEQTVILANAESVGLQTRPPARLATLLPPASDALTERQIAAVLGVVSAMNDAQAAGTDVLASDELAAGTTTTPGATSDTTTDLGGHQVASRPAHGADGPRTRSTRTGGRRRQG